MVKRWGVRSLWLFILSLTYVAILPFCTWHSVRSSSQTRPTVLAKMWRPYCWVQNNFTIQSSFTLILTLELSGITWPQASLKCWSQIVKVISENQSNQNSIVKQTTKTLISIFCSTNICCCDLHFMLQEICHGFAFFFFFCHRWLWSSFHAARNLPWFALSVVIFGTTIWQRLTGNNKIHLFSEKIG